MHQGIFDHILEWENDYKTLERKGLGSCFGVMASGDDDEKGNLSVVRGNNGKKKRVMACDCDGKLNFLGG